MRKATTSYRLVLCLCFNFAVGHAAAADDRTTTIQKSLGCTLVQPATQIAAGLRGNPALYFCVKGGGLTNRAITYAEVNGVDIREYKNRYELGARFAPFETEAEATALAMAFSFAEPRANIVLPEGMKQQVKKLPSRRIVRSGDGYRVYLYDRAPQQGQCEIPGLYEIAVQVWRDGLSRPISRLKLYESVDKKTVCED